MEVLAGKFTGKTKTKGNGHTVTDSCNQVHNDVEDEEGYLYIAMVDAGKRRFGWKSSPALDVRR